MKSTDFYRRFVHAVVWPLVEVFIERTGQIMTQIQQLQADVANLTGVVGTVQTTVSSLQSQIAALKSNPSTPNDPDFQTALGQLETDINGLQQAVAPPAASGDGQDTSAGGQGTDAVAAS